jgi:hypothetical protein
VSAADTAVNERGLHLAPTPRRRGRVLRGAPGRGLAAVALLVALLVGPLATTVLGARRGPSGAATEGAAPVLRSAAAAAAAPILDGAADAAPGASRFVALSPTRVLDSRSGLGMPSGSARKVAAQEALGLRVGGVGGVPGGATAVVLNLTVTGNDGPSYVTAWPAGRVPPETSVINLEYAGQTIANLVTVPVGADGSVDLFTVAATHLIADVAGYYVGAGSATSGRFNPIATNRVLDTRTANGFFNGPLPAGGTAHVDVSAVTGIPRDAVAAVVNLTVANTAGAGYFSVVPPGADPTAASNLNVEVAGQTIANQVVARLEGGRLDVYSSTGGDVIVDVAGWYTGASAADAATGLFVPVAPSRLLDTRRADLSPVHPAKPQTGRVVDVTAAGRGGLPAGGFSAVVLNLTATNADGYGYVTAWAAGLPKPWSSNLNTVRADQTIANHAVVGVSDVGYALEVQGAAHLVTDVSGYFTGDAPAAGPGYTPNAVGSAPTAGSHGFLYRLVDGSFARWNPCKPISYRVNYAGAPAFARSEVDAAVARVEAATGIDLVDLGDLGGADGNSGIAPAGVDAVIAFVSPAENQSIVNVAGLGGGGYAAPWNGAGARVVSGFVLINETLGFTEGLGPSGLQGLLLHELGHMMGLDHVQDLGEVMYPVMHAVPNGYGPGDRQGLWHLGAAQGCLQVAGSTPAGPPTAAAGSPAGPPPLATAGAATGPPVVRMSYCGLGHIGTA